MTINRINTEYCSIDFFSTDLFYYLLIGFFAAMITFLSLDIPFFWDNVSLVSRIALFFYDNNFDSLILPTNIDSGHPPFYGLYLAFCWKLFGKTLAVSHLAVFPFLLGAGIAYYHLAKYFFAENKLFLFTSLLLFWLEPTLLAQSVLGGFDIAIVFAYLLAINGLLYSKRKILILALCLLAVVNLRGIIGIFLIFCCDIFIQLLRQNINFKTRSLQANILYFVQLIVAYIPSGVIVTVWYVYHYYEAGFLVFNYDSPWAEDYGYVDFQGLMRNLGIIGWRFLDFGRAFLWLVFAYLGLQIIRFRLQVKQQEILLIGLIVLPLIFYIPIITLRETPILHRYLINYYLLFALLVLLFLEKIRQFQGVKMFKNKLKIIFFILIFGLLTGPTWGAFYPATIAKGWDAFLGFVPIFELQKEMNYYLESENIDFQKVASTFPICKPKTETHLLSEQKRYVSKEKQPFFTHQYILQSNVCNDFEDEELKILKNKKYFTLKKEVRQWPLFMRLYENTGLKSH